MTTTTSAAGLRTPHHWVAGAERARLSLASAADVEAAVAAAEATFPKGRDTSLARGTQIVFRFRELLNARADELAELITAEYGKVLADAHGQEVVEFACGIQHLMKGGFTENASTKVDVASIANPSVRSP